MRPKTRLLYNAFLEQIATLNGVPSAEQKFAVSTPVEQTLESLIQESAGFLGMVNSIPVTDQTGEILGLYSMGPLASRTDTSDTDRPTSDATGLADIDYVCKQTNSDTHIPYSKLDLWAKFPDFQTRIRDAIVRQVALDRIMVGFNGVSAAAETDAATYPLLQDVNIGWLQKLRTGKAANWLSDGDHTSGAEKEIRVANGVSGAADYDYLTLEGLVFDMIHSLLDPWHRESPDLMVVLGRDLLRDRYLTVLDSQTAPTEKNAVELMLVNKTIAGRRAYTAPYFPGRSIAVLPLSPRASTARDSLLSIYYQEGSRRRAILDNPKRDRIEDYQSVNEAYVVEDYGAMALADNITFPEEGTWVTAP
jgi:P2 family phage major capsid protein